MSKWFPPVEKESNETMEAGCLQSPVAVPTSGCQPSFCSWAAGLFYIRCLFKCTLSEIATIFYIQEQHVFLNKSALAPPLVFIIKNCQID